MQINEKEVDCSNMHLDQSDVKTKKAFYILAGINLLVILFGFYSFYIKYHICEKMRFRTVMFYVLALSCLVVLEFYFFSQFFYGSDCGEDFLKTYPAFSYLLTGLVYTQ